MPKLLAEDYVWRLSTQKCVKRDIVAIGLVAIVL
jgi:hypothetical protein